MATTTTTKKKFVYKQDPDGVFRIKKGLSSAPSADKSSKQSHKDNSVDNILNELIDCAYTIIEEPAKVSSEPPHSHTNSPSAGTKLGTKPRERKTKISRPRANLSDTDSVISDRTTTSAGSSIPESATNAVISQEILSPRPTVAKSIPTVNTNFAGGVPESTTSSPIKESPSANLPTTLIDFPETKSFYIPFLSVSMSAPMENLRFHWPSFIGGCVIALILNQMQPLLKDLAVTMLGILLNFSIVLVIGAAVFLYLGLFSTLDVSRVFLNLKRRLLAGRAIPVVVGERVPEPFVAEQPVAVEETVVPVHELSEAPRSRRSSASPQRIAVAPPQVLTEALPPHQREQARTHNSIRPFTGAPRRPEYAKVYDNGPRYTQARHQVPMEKKNIPPKMTKYPSDYPPVVNPPLSRKTLSQENMIELNRFGIKGVEDERLNELPFVNEIKFEDSNQYVKPVRKDLPETPRRISQDSMQNFNLGRLNTVQSNKSVLNTRGHYKEFMNNTK